MTSIERRRATAPPARIPDRPGPAWFQEAARSTHRDNYVDVDGCEIHYLEWGQEGDPVVLLVHGSAANAHWWSHLGSILAAHHRIVAVDLSGHGDSGRRGQYSFTQWADEVLAVAEAVGDGRPAVLVGHSIGGHVVARASNKRPDLVKGIVLCEMPLPEPMPPEPAPQNSSFGRRLYRSVADAVKWFRPVPPQGELLDFVVEHVVAHSLTPRDGQWGWKFDADIFGPAQLLVDLPELATLSTLTCPVAMIVGESGHPATMSDTLAATSLQRPDIAIEIPSAGHNPMLDQPLALVVALRSVLWTWADEPTLTARTPAAV